jgi:hypothetical protein
MFATSKKRLEDLIASSGVPLASLAPQAGLELMLRFYGDDPADGYLSCTWGVVTRYGEEEFGFDITRTFSWPPDFSFEPTPDFSLIFKVGPRAKAGDFPQTKWCTRHAENEWMSWCICLDDTAAFRSAIEESPAFKAWGRLPAAGVAIVCQDEEHKFALYDCWGARDPSRPVVSMIEEQWLQSDDVSLMLRWFRQEWRGEKEDLDRLLQRYLLACCRRIWRFLPEEASRSGIEVAERFVDGQATREELHRADWWAEGAAFGVERRSDSESVARWCDEVSRIPPEELGAMIHSPRPEDDLAPHGLLKHAAYFADDAICYPGYVPESIEKYRLFLPTPLLREIVGNPFHPTSDRPRPSDRTST